MDADDRVRFAVDFVMRRHGRNSGIHLTAIPTRRGSLRRTQRIRGQSNRGRLPLKRRPSSGFGWTATVSDGETRRAAIERSVIEEERVLVSSRNRRGRRSERANRSRRSRFDADPRGAATACARCSSHPREQASAPGNGRAEARTETSENHRLVVPMPRSACGSPSRKPRLPGPLTAWYRRSCRGREQGHHAENYRREIGARARSRSILLFRGKESP